MYCTTAAQRAVSCRTHQHRVSKHNPEAPPPSGRALEAISFHVRGQHGLSAAGTTKQRLFACGHLPDEAEIGRPRPATLRPRGPSAARPFYVRAAAAGKGLLGHGEPPEGGPAARRPHLVLGAALLGGLRPSSDPALQTGPGVAPAEKGQASEGSAPPVTSPPFRLRGLPRERPDPALLLILLVRRCLGLPPLALRLRGRHAAQRPLLATPLPRLSPHPAPGALKVTHPDAANSCGARAKRAERCGRRALRAERSRHGNGRGSAVTGPGVRAAEGGRAEPLFRPGAPAGLAAGGAAGWEGRKAGRQEGKGRSGRGSAACGDQPLPRVLPSGLRCWGLC